jgi:hypothetical protein
VDDFRLATIYRCTLLPDGAALNLIDWISPRKHFHVRGKRPSFTARPMSGPCPENKSGERNSRWWIYGQGSVFNLPFKRSDVFTASFGIGNSSVEVTASVAKVCTLSRMGTTVTRSQNRCRWTLNWASSSELAEGRGASLPKAIASVMLRSSSATTSKLHGSHRAPDREVGLAHVTDDERVNKDGSSRGRSRSIRITSTIIGELMASTCGVLSANKKIPAQFLQAPSFRKGLVDGFSGDGSVGGRCQINGLCG